MRYLGVTLTEDLSFNRHMNIIVAKSYGMLGFLKRVCKDFRNVAALKSVYFAHVKSHLEYTSVVWEPYYQNYDDKIESVQKKFLIYALRRSMRRDENYRLPSFVSRCESIGIESLSCRRFNLSALYVSDVLTGGLDSSALRSKINVIQPVRILRNVQYLTIKRHDCNIMLAILSILLLLVDYETTLFSLTESYVTALLLCEINGRNTYRSKGK